MPAEKIKIKNVVLEPEKLNIKNKKIEQNKETSITKKNINTFSRSLPLEKKSKNILITEDNTPNITSIYKYIDKSYVHLNIAKNEDAKKEYKNALSNYHSLNVDEKKECYQVLYELYLILKNK